MRILLAHDGSGGAAKAAELVGALAWPEGSVVRVVSVIEPTMVGLTAWAGVVDYSAEADAQISEYYKGELADTVARLSSPTRRVESAVLRGRPATAIVDDAKAFGADVIVVGSRGRGGIRSLVLGSVSSEVVDHAPCPVLVARQSTLSAVVLATDGSPPATLAQTLVSEWPIFEGVPVRVVSVADVPRPWDTGIAPTMYRQVVEAYTKDLDEAKRQSQEIAARTVEALRAAGREAVADARVGDAAGEIIAAAVESNAEMIVIGTRGHTGLTRLLLGSVARNVVHGSGASVLVVRARASANAEQ
ncbi:MAG TPA: universal stress protein [Candidatus Limnocylindrales bacterium]|nr:universal stress protein [Candidatus Limnocylindrales bacterium]